MTQTCYRHPDRETAVSCSNCGRPICPDCMTPTPVGMRCPECARQKTKVKAGAAAFGRSNAAPATYALVAINVAIFLAELAGGITKVIDNFGTYGPAVADGDVYRLLSVGGHLFGAAGGAICAAAIFAGDRGRLGANRIAAEIGVCIAVAVVAVVGSLLAV